MKKFTRKQAAKITNIPDRRIQFYTDQKVLSNIKTNVGRGIARTYSQKNLIELFVIKELHLNGINLTTIKKILIKVKELISDLIQFNEEGDYIGHIDGTSAKLFTDDRFSNEFESENGKTKMDVKLVKNYQNIRPNLSDSAPNIQIIEPDPLEPGDVIDHPPLLSIFLYVFDRGNNVAISRVNSNDLYSFVVRDRKTVLSINLTKEIEIVANT